MSQGSYPEHRDMRFSILAQKCQSGQTLLDDWYEAPVEAEAACVALGLAATFFVAVRGLAAAGFALVATFFLAAGAAAAGVADLVVPACFASGAVPSVLVLRIEAIS